MSLLMFSIFVCLCSSVSCRPLGDLLGTRREKMNAGAGLADIDPMAIDRSVSCDVPELMSESDSCSRLLSPPSSSLLSSPPQVGFDSIGGLWGHISALKEMVVFPLLYPEVFDNFKIQPPRFIYNIYTCVFITQVLYFTHCWISTRSYQ